MTDDTVSPDEPNPNDCPEETLEPGAPLVMDLPEEYFAEYCEPEELSPCEQCEGSCLSEPEAEALTCGASCECDCACRGEKPPATPAPEEADDYWPTQSRAAIGLCFRKGGKVYFFHPGDFEVKIGDWVVVETEKGIDIGEVASIKRSLARGEQEPTRSLVRLASPGDVRKKQALTEKERQAFKVCEEKVAGHKLEMKLIDASYTLDGKRLTFSFVSEGRVDFRDLVRDLAQAFRCRIELRQVGVRDQAKLIGGLGPCGRPLCCATFLRDFCSVGIRLAKDQGLSLNPAKISGSCDRLMCCLRYEHSQYVQMNKRMPKLGAIVEKDEIVGQVVERNLLTGTIRLRTEEGREVVLTEEQLFGDAPVQLEPEGPPSMLAARENRKAKAERDFAAGTTPPVKRRASTRPQKTGPAPGSKSGVKVEPAPGTEKPTPAAPPAAPQNQAAPPGEGQAPARKRRRGPRRRGGKGKSGGGNAPNNPTGGNPPSGGPPAASGSN
ncbi:MAG TPA: stage 0 sporulation family protein [Armatimonadota bacterium]|jgi:cell fate regulator YaaT (PSP1 superfamily)